MFGWLFLIMGYLWVYGNDLVERVFDVGGRREDIGMKLYNYFVIFLEDV